MHCASAEFPQNFHTKEFGEILVFYAVHFVPIFNKVANRNGLFTFYSMNEMVKLQN